MSEKPVGSRNPILEYFPNIGGKEAQATKLQTIVIPAIEKEINQGKKIIVMESPVGTGKSAMAITLGLWSGDAHIITPRKSLQDQYQADFQEYTVMMKGRSNYPCTYEASPAVYEKLSSDIKSGRRIPINKHADTCGTGPCKDSSNVYRTCTKARPCPYRIAIDTAKEADIIIHNIHSFMYQTNFALHFDKRHTLIIDEAHDLEQIVRDFKSIDVRLYRELTKDEIDELVDVANGTSKLGIEAVLNILGQIDHYPEPAAISKWKVEWGSEDYLPLLSDDSYGFSIIREHLINKSKSLNAGYQEKLVKIITLLESGKVVLSASSDYSVKSKKTETVLQFTPMQLNNSAKDLFFNYGEHVILMSGTIYDKEMFCSNLGIDPAEVAFIRIGSPFPAADRPILVNSEYQVNTAHEHWDINFEQMCENIENACSKFPDVRGLIHVPSYRAAQQLEVKFKGTECGKRFVFHDKDNLMHQLEGFYNNSPPDAIFVSPVCQQGVDFKGDRARFQLILRVPFLNTSDAFTKFKCKTDYNWYNYRALIIFGQMTGRINRFLGDWGYTILLDERFNSFLKKNWKVLPEWFKASVEFK